MPVMRVRNAPRRQAFSDMGVTDMGETHDKKLGARRRKALSVRLRAYFDGLKADLEADSEAFLRNVISKAAERSDRAPPSSQQRGG
jgi:hypothetical protein